MRESRNISVNRNLRQNAKPLSKPVAGSGQVFGDFPVGLIAGTAARQIASVAAGLPPSASPSSGRANRSRATRSTCEDGARPNAAAAEVDLLISEFAAIRPKYEALTNNVENLIKTLLRSKSIDYLAVESRTKTVETFADKIRRPDKQGKYSEIHQMTDLSGIRVIAYYLKDLRLICDLIESNFEIDIENSTDKNGSLAPDRFGYLSIHYIVSHNKSRETLPENEAFAGLKIEIQIRTVLQHAWAALDRKLNRTN